MMAVFVAPAGRMTTGAAVARRTAAVAGDAVRTEAAAAADSHPGEDSPEEEDSGHAAAAAVVDRIRLAEEEGSVPAEAAGIDPAEGAARTGLEEGIDRAEEDTGRAGADTVDRNPAAAAVLCSRDARVSLETLLRSFCEHASGEGLTAVSTSVTLVRHGLLQLCVSACRNEVVIEMVVELPRQRPRCEERR